MASARTLGNNFGWLYYAGIRGGNLPLRARDRDRKRASWPRPILVIDTETGEVLHTKDIDNKLKSSKPYKQWLRDNARHIEASYDTTVTVPIEGEALDVYQKMFQVTLEERDQVLKPLAQSGNEAVGSMGDDTPMAVLSARERSLYDYFRQKFAQVTNPPIDPLREAIVMSLEVDLGGEANLFEETKHTQGV